MKKSSNDIYEYFIRLYDEDEFESIMRTSNSTQRFELLLNYACNAVHSWRDLFKLCEDYPLLRLKTEIIAQLKIDTLPLIETAQNFQILHSHLSNYFDRLSVLTDKAERELKRLEHKDESVLEWLEEADSYDEFMSEFDCGFLEGTASYFKAQKQYALEKINEWYLELKEELTDSDNKEEYGVLKCRKMLQEVKKLKNTYTSLINEATEENAFEIAVFDFSTFSSKLQNEIENFDEDDDDDEDDEDEDDKEERREERIERLTVVAGAVANGAGVAAKTTGKIIWKIISFPFVLIGKFFKFLFCTKLGRFLLALIILAGAGIAVWQTKIYEPIVDWVTGIFSPNEDTPDDNPPDDTPPDVTPPDDNPPEDIQDFIFKLNSNDTYTLKEYIGNDSSVIIPNKIDNKFITVISDLAFDCCSGLTSIVIPDSVTTIGNGAFKDCSGLTSVTIGNSVTSIGDYAFGCCSGLTSIVIPDSVTSIGSSVFSDCWGLTSIVIPDKVTSIGSSTFWYCCGLTSIVIPDSVTTIGDYAFGYCSGLTSVVLPNSVTTIGDYVFEGCSSLTSITIPDSVTSIGSFAFSGCGGLTSISVGINNIKFKSINNCLLTGDGEILVVGCKNSIIPNSVTTISDGAFSGCSELTSIIIPDSVTSIGSFAFYGCSSLTSITIPNNITYIGDSAFSDCRSLTDIIIPNSVNSIGDSAFNGCSRLTSIVIPDSVTTIGKFAFSYCSSLTIYCETTSKPSGWDSTWNDKCPVVWGYKNN